MAKIGVEESLSDVQQALREKGYEVVQLNHEYGAANCDCCVITGMDKNVMGMQDVTIEGPVINADGLTADQVCSEVESKLQ
ncbi:YkuS family protein [Pradoshia sp.]|uniref:YkuS family protein n=1 Tax=Pradoshia sp. TaxID=2651281 RepID=UPI003EFF86A0